MKYKVRVRIGVSNRSGQRVSLSSPVCRGGAGAWNVAASQAPPRDVAAASGALYALVRREKRKKGLAAVCLCGGRCLYG